MARRKRRPLVPEAREELDQLKANVMKKQGYKTDPSNPDNVKYEVARELGIPLNDEYNGNLTSKQAGKVGGNIGGNMVKEMIRMAQENLNKRG
ncbi:small acid-soluble spore protein [Bacillus sp. HNG]|uniref:alpha/beta-type small acid-soluble spore protein n=1 Tax=Bacillus sp. HNG TaxID=2293325 RepID=UPI000E2F7848|nr:alpha/beta-type small acid-soluble spore protein [Bacillus sp. HNG]RFB17194.1 small acid-soluble spore protein [Bacillus sp. HNG]